MSTTTRSKKLKAVAPEDFDKKFGYVLHVENDDRGLMYDGMNGREIKSQKFKSRANILLRSVISWDGSDAVYENKDKDGNYDTTSKLISGHAPGRQAIRYFDGCGSLFEDEQNKIYDRETIQRMVSSTREFFFQNGYFYVLGDDTMLKQYMDICSWNADSPYRVKSVSPMFHALDAEIASVKIDSDIDLLEEALALAKKASESKMMFHANFLGVELVDPKTTNAHSAKTIRALYREAAKKNPAEFVRTYKDDALEIQGWLEKSLQEGKVSTTLIPNQAVWKDTGYTICDISGLKTHEGILNKLIEFTKSEDGKGFRDILEKVYK
jgi:hypothetical protein